MYKQTININFAIKIDTKDAAALVRIANQFKSKIRCSSDECGQFDPKDLFSILDVGGLLGSFGYITAEGVDEKAAVDEIVKFFVDRHGASVVDPEEIDAVVEKLNNASFEEKLKMVEDLLNL